MRLFITGGAGFIGAALVRRLVAADHDVLNVDLLTYAADLRRIAQCESSSNYRFARADIADGKAIKTALAEFRPDAIVNLAAESHVDRSIDAPGVFMRTNILGTYTLLEASVEWLRSEGRDMDLFRFVQVSTDEVFGSLQANDPPFDETTRYDPSSPYSASKAAADHLVSAWGNTYGLPAIITNCSNNYGPYQHREKLIPTVIGAALSGAPIPVYGDGKNVRDWLNVEDHVDGLMCVLQRGRPGERYLFGGRAERRNIDLIGAICRALDSKAPKPKGSYADQIELVADRPGHDRRYAIDPSRTEKQLGWCARHSLESGLSATIDWYLANRDWLSAPERLGLGRPTK